MLVLSRKLGEKIYINNNICITVVDIDRGKIRLGIEAPRDVPIFRQELIAAGKPTPPPVLGQISDQTPLREEGFRCYPTRGDSLAYYARWYGKRLVAGLRVLPKIGGRIQLRIH